ncbi:hypothetical protein DFJ74DRAFT_701832 [Hyaloraphidium curvatum]|nr:hypothetical protein DFJ74DRAFT_701832 [Hyaloraphidium curvatum]
MFRRQNGTAIQCQLELFTQLIGTFSLADGTAVWTGWISMLCNANVTVWDSVELLNLETEFGPLVTNRQAGIVDPPAALGPGFTFFSTAKIRVPILVDSDLTYYPYDRVWVPITMEALEETSALRVSFPQENAIIADTDFATDDEFTLYSTRAIVVTETIDYQFRYLGGRNATYDRITVVYSFYRSDYVNWIQAMLPTFLSFVLSMGALFLSVVVDFEARMGILGASVFVVVLNINVLNAFLGFPSVMTTGDLINLVTMSIIGLVIVETIWERWLQLRFEELKEAEEKRLEELEEVENRKLDAQELAMAISKTIAELDDDGDQGGLRRRSADPAQKSDGVAAAGVMLEVPKTEAPLSAPRQTTGTPLVSPTNRTATATPARKTSKGCCNLIPNMENVPLDKYEQALLHLSLATFVFFMVAYIAINIGLLVGYRPSPCYEDEICR